MVTREPGAGANLPALRGHNAALVLDLLRTAGEGGISRLELAERTGLTPQAVSKITARLRAEGLAAEAGRRASTGGKPRTVLRLVPSAAYAVGVHLDRDELTVLLADLAGTPVAVDRAPLDLGAGPERVLDRAAAAVRALRGRAPDGARPLGAGVAMPGPLDHRSGTAGRVTGFPEWDGHPVRAGIEERLGLPAVLDKDTNAAALGLALRPGAPRSFAYVHLGTGLGAGLVVDGAPLRGERTGAGELGHQTVLLDGPPCVCGGRGCLEVLCLAAVARGDTAEAARVLGTGAANLVRLLDIDEVLLGGRVVLAAPDAFTAGVARILAGPPRAGGARGDGGRDGRVARADAPAGGVPDGGASAGGVPDRGASDGGVPDRGASAGGVPDGGAPAGGVPDRGAPAGGVPDRGAPAGGVPVAVAADRDAVALGAAQLVLAPLFGQDRRAAPARAAGRPAAEPAGR